MGDPSSTSGGDNDAPLPAEVVPHATTVADRSTVRRLVVVFLGTVSGSILLNVVSSLTGDPPLWVVVVVVAITLGSVLAVAPAAPLFGQRAASSRAGKVFLGAVIAACFAGTLYLSQTEWAAWSVYVLSACLTVIAVFAASAQYRSDDASGGATEGAIDPWVAWGYSVYYGWYLVCLALAVQGASQVASRNPVEGALLLLASGIAVAVQIRFTFVDAVTSDEQQREAVALGIGAIGMTIIAVMLWTSGSGISGTVVFLMSLVPTSLAAVLLLTSFRWAVTLLGGLVFFPMMLVLGAVTLVAAVTSFNSFVRGELLGVASALLLAGLSGAVLLGSAIAWIVQPTAETPRATDSGMLDYSVPAYQRRIAHLAKAGVWIGLLAILLGAVVSALAAEPLGAVALAVVGVSMATPFAMWQLRDTRLRLLSARWWLEPREQQSPSEK